MRIKILALLALICLAPVVQAAQTGGSGASTVSYNVDMFESCFPLLADVTAAGCAVWHVSSPARLTPGSTGQACTIPAAYTNCYQITATVSLDVAPAVALGIIASATTTYAGCHIANQGTTVIAGFTLVNYVFIAVDPGSQYCGGALHWRLQTPALVNIAQFAHNFEFLVPVLDNYNRLCNADTWTTQTPHPESPSQTYPATSVCATNEIATEFAAFTAAFCPGPTHGHCDIHLHGDVGVDVLNDVIADDMLTVNSSVSLTLGNVSINGTVGATEEPGFDGSLYILMMVFVLALAHLGELRRDNNYRTIAGFITLIGGFVALWELNRLGFDNLQDNMLYAAIGWMFVHFWIGFYLLIPKTWDDETNA